MRVFKYRGGDWLLVKRDLRSLALNEVYASPFTSLNDPFEATIVIEQKSFELGSLILGWATGSSEESVSKASNTFKDAVRRFVTFTKDVGVYSLSKTATDELLWAHYGNSHQGFCLEYDLDQLLAYKLDGEEILDVEYKKVPPVIRMDGFLVTDSNKKRLLRSLVATKSIRWKYEEEIRVCVGKPGLREYDYRALKAVYFGVRCSRRLMRLAMRLLRGRGLMYFQMVLINNSYKLEAVEIQDEFPVETLYRERISPVDEGIPYLDDKTRPYERELLTAIEIVRREPYCEHVRDACISGSKGTKTNPVFYVCYDRSDGLPRNMFLSLNEIRSHELYA